MDPNEFDHLRVARWRGSRRQLVQAGAGVSAGFVLATVWRGGIGRAKTAPARYSVTSIGVLKGDDASAAYAINAGGAVVGTSTNSTAALSRAVLYRAGKLRDLTGGATQSSYVWSVNKANHAVGFMAGAPPTTQAMLWDGKTATVLPMLGGDGAQAFGINASGAIAGSSNTTPGGTYQACRWDAGVVSALSADPGLSSALDINAGGQVVGANAAGHAALWENANESDLGTLGGDISLARTINDAGLIAGHSTTTPGSHLGDPGTHAFVWNKGVMTDLGALPEADVSYAWDINTAGVAAGTSAGAAVIWQDGVIANLNDLIPAGAGWNLMGAYGINDAGQIAGIGEVDGKRRGFRLTPVAP